LNRSFVNRAGKEVLFSMKTCAVYARVSTDMQGESLENQVDYAREYIRRLGDDYRLDEACVYTDFDQSGYYTRFLQRPAIQRALEDAKARRYDVIVFKEISRISRDQAEHVEIVSRFTQHGVRIIAINDNLDSNRPETLDLLGIHSVMSELESKRISSRVSSGKKSLARRGFWVGEAPIGYTVDPKTRRLEVDPAYAEIPKIIFQLFTQEGYGTFRIAHYLNQSGLYTKNRRLWSRVTVNRVLKNPAYVGDLVYGRTRNTLKRIFDDNGYTKVQGRHAMPEEDWVVIQGAHPALVDRDTFAKAQSIMAGRSRQNPRRSKHPLTGILTCGHCGSGMVCQTQRYNGNAYRYYSCARAFRFGRSLCDQPNLPATKLEQTIWQCLMNELTRYRDVEVKVKPKKKEVDRQRLVQRLERELEKAQLGLERLLTDNDIPQATLDRMKMNFVDTIRKLEGELQQVQAQTQHEQERQEWRVEVREYLTYLGKLNLSDLDEARRWFHGLIQHIVVHGRDIKEIELKYALYEFSQSRTAHIDGAV
jgi:site-specific DNA recombinase